MKIITQRVSEIQIDNINENHLIVAVIEGLPCILGKGYHELNRSLTFFILGYPECRGSGTITEGNGFSYLDSHDSIKKMVEMAMASGKDNMVAAFDKDKWKDALQWLIDNGGIKF